MSDPLDQIAPGIRLYIHPDAIKDGSVKFISDLGIALRINGKLDDEGYILVNRASIDVMAKAHRMVKITTSIGGGYFTVDGDPDKERFPFDIKTKEARKIARRKATLRAAELYHEYEEPTSS